ncbi:ATP-binding protein [Streptomyces sp. NPDC015127]|uniref:ATP-binding protein n=1 Tax=Streptomyces sp. NPDC015127 TaxID=3364939 RepID=UPI003702D0E6
MLLVVSELVTNAIEHALPPLRLHLAVDEGNHAVRVEVTDGGPAGREGAWAASCEPDEHGRGMKIVDRIALAHGVRVHSNGSLRWAVLSA